MRSVSRDGGRAGVVALQAIILQALCGISKARLCNVVISVDYTTTESFLRECWAD